LVRIQKTVSSLIKHTIGTRIYYLEIKYQDLRKHHRATGKHWTEERALAVVFTSIEKEERLWLCYIDIGAKSRDGRRWAEETSSIPV
jgi:hypothetical protein